MSRNARWGLVLFSGGALLLCVLLSRWLVRRITQPIQQAVSTANQVASLDLSGPIVGHDRDEAGRLLLALQQMQNALHILVSEVQGASHSVAEGATQIAAGNLDFSGRTEIAASFLRQTAAMIEELTESTYAAQAGAAQTDVLVNTASKATADGSAVMLEVMQTINDISASSKQIMDITSVIDGIAFQTNILALNAAVEAARAGEQGRGFAVVASEVRMLANRSAAAAHEIKTLIGVSAEKVKLGTAKVNQGRDAMSTIAQAVEQVRVAMAEIHNSSRIQSKGMLSINSAISQLDQMAQQNAAVVEESAAAAQNLQYQASSLRKVSQRFRLPALALAA